MASHCLRPSLKRVCLRSQDSPRCNETFSCIARLGTAPSKTLTLLKSCGLDRLAATTRASSSRRYASRSGSLDVVGSIDEDALIIELDLLDVTEPIAESRAENALAIIAAAFAFGAGVWAVLGPTKGQEFFAGYLLEQSLSIDNLFVFILVFDYFKTPKDYQNTVLTYGIVTAAILRLVLIVLGVDIVEHFQPILLFFAAILVFSSLKLLFDSDDNDDEDLGENTVVKICKKLIPCSDTYDSNNFFTTDKTTGARLATPLLLVLMVVEISDVVFAVDSIPAVFGVTLDPFIVYSSNMFAILSLRGLYGFVSSVMGQLEYLEKAVAIVLGFVGMKILGEFVGFDIATDVSLGIVASILSGGVALSYLKPAVVGAIGGGGEDNDSSSLD